MASRNNRNVAENMSGIVQALRNTIKYEGGDFSLSAETRETPLWFEITATDNSAVNNRVSVFVVEEGALRSRNVAEMENFSVVYCRRITENAQYECNSKGIQVVAESAELHSAISESLARKRAQPQAQRIRRGDVGIAVAPQSARPQSASARIADVGNAVESQSIAQPPQRHARHRAQPQAQPRQHALAHPQQHGSGGGFEVGTISGGRGQRTPRCSHKFVAIREPLFKTGPDGRRLFNGTRILHYKCELCGVCEDSPRVERKRKTTCE